MRFFLKRPASLVRLAVQSLADATSRSAIEGDQIVGPNDELFARGERAPGNSEVFWVFSDAGVARMREELVDVTPPVSPAKGVR